MTARAAGSGASPVMRGFAVTLELPVLWGDMDALRHVNNARYFAWFEAARIAYFDRLRDVLPGSGGRVGFAEVGPILASASCDYLRPVVYPGTVAVGVKVIEIGSSSVRMEYAVARTDTPGEACAKGTSVVVLVRYATLEKVRVPEEVRAAIAAMEKAAEGPARVAAGGRASSRWAAHEAGRLLRSLPGGSVPRTPSMLRPIPIGVSDFRALREQGWSTSTSPSSSGK